MQMSDFPRFMKILSNRVDSSQQNTDDVEGYYYTSNDGSQMVFWTCHSDKESNKHSHSFDEYMVVISGKYTVCLENGTEEVMGPGDEILIPAGMVQWGRCVAGTRSIHAFGGKRI